MILARVVGDAAKTLPPDMLHQTFLDHKLDVLQSPRVSLTSRFISTPVEKAPVGA
jgi:hypothetical protein